MINGVRRLSTWQPLKAEHAKTAGLDVRTLINCNDYLDRSEVAACGLVLDHSRVAISDNALNLLFQTAKLVDLPNAIHKLMNGAMVNPTENRAALHTALRASDSQLDQLPSSVKQAVLSERTRMLEFAEQIRTGVFKNMHGLPYKHLICLGVGGSELGPHLVFEGLSNPKEQPVAVRFVPNIDPLDLELALDGLALEQTLFVVVSKSFTTAETMINANECRARVQALVGDRWAEQFVAVTADAECSAAWGIKSQQTYAMWQWVGGRYSLWSAAGLPAAVAIGAEQFEELLLGAQQLDQHVLNTDVENNLAIRHALVAFWLHAVVGIPQMVCVPYSQRLRYLPGWRQQLDMESNGKGVDVHGEHMPTAAGPAIWGSQGTNAQHAYFQWLHQTDRAAAVEFILPMQARYGQQSLQQQLIINGLSQAEAFSLGRTVAELCETDAYSSLTPHKQMPGNRPVMLLGMDDLSARSLGALLALYEHQVYLLACLWNINPFDQWGVEFGKSIADEYRSAMCGGEAHVSLAGQRWLNRLAK